MPERKQIYGYTTTGDGTRVMKHDPLIGLIGDLDELNAALGVVRAYLPPNGARQAEMVLSLQRDVFHWSAFISGAPKTSSAIAIATTTAALYASRQEMEQSLEPLRNFIISGGSQTASFIHLARTVCRRVERNLVATMAAVSGSVVKEKLLNLGEWLNELSNWLFVLARYANWVEGRADINVNG